MSPQWAGPRWLRVVPGGVRGTARMAEGTGWGWGVYFSEHHWAPLREGGRDGDQVRPPRTSPEAPPSLLGVEGRAKLTWGHSDGWPFHPGLLSLQPACVRRARPRGVGSPAPSRLGSWPGASLRRYLWWGEGRKEDGGRKLDKGRPP